MLALIPWVAVVVLSYILLDWYRRNPVIDNIHKKYVLVTGCDSGFGKALVERLDKLGCHVFAACLTEEGQKQLSVASSGNVKTVHIDVADSESVRRAYGFVCEIIPRNEGLWGLVNNAGILYTSVGPLEWLQPDDYLKLFDTNTVGMIDVTMTFLPLLKIGKGRIINMSSITGRIPFPLFLPDTVSKAAVNSWSDGLRLYLKTYETNVSVHIIEAGQFNTEMMDETKLAKTFESSWKKINNKTKEEFGENFYNEYLKRTLKETKDKSSTQVSLVIDAYVHALTAVCPRYRYTAGRDAYFYLFLSYLPSSLTDIILKIFQVRPKKIIEIKRIPGHS